VISFGQESIHEHSSTFRGIKQSVWANDRCGRLSDQAVARRIFQECLFSADPEQKREQIAKLQAIYELGQLER